MSNSFYNHGSFPTTGSSATSASMRAELDLIGAAFDKMPTLSGGNANMFVLVNSTGTALTASSTLPSLTVNDTFFVVQDDADNTRKFRFEATSITAGATRILTVPDADLTIVGTATTQTLTNKTLGAFTISGTVAGGGNQINNVIIGTTTPLAGAFTTLTASTSITNSGLTAGRVTYASTAGLLADSANFTYNGQQLTSSGSASAAVIGYVATTSAADGYSGIRLINTGASGREYQVAVGGSTSGQSGNWYVYDAIAAAVRLVIDSAGALGIGYTTPSSIAALAVKDIGATGTLALLSSTASNILYIKNTGTSVDFKYNDAYPMTWSINGSERMRLDSSGRVGVGNTTPSNYQASANQLVVGLTGSNGITVVSGTTGKGNLFFSDGTSGTEGYRGFVQYDHSLDCMNLGTNALTGVTIDTYGSLTVPGNIRGFQSTSLQLLANQYTDIVYAGAGGYGTLISGILTVYSTFSGAITQNSYFCNAVGNGNAGNGVSMLASGDYSTASNFILYSRGAALGGGSYVISVYNASGNTVGITYSFTPVGQGNGASYYNSLTNNGSAGAGTGLPSGVSVVFGQNNAEVKASGVTFPAAQAASSGANTLDDYEEGTFTPTDGSGAGLSITFNNAKYTKIGRLVYISISTIEYPVTASTAAARIDGLPFTNTAADVGSSTLISNNTFSNRALVVATNATIFFYPTASAGQALNNQLSGTVIYGFSAVYQV